MPRSGVKIKRSLWLNRVEQFDFACAYCGLESRTFWDAAFTKDHIYAYSKGGKDSVANLAPACLYCNREKGNRPLEEWIFERWLTKTPLKVHPRIVQHLTKFAHFDWLKESTRKSGETVPLQEGVHLLKYGEGPRVRQTPPAPNAGKANIKLKPEGGWSLD